MKTETTKVRTFALRNEAEFAQQLLRAEAIESQVKGDDASGWAPHISLATGGFSIWVLEENKDNAIEILAGRFDSDDPETQS